MRPLWSRTHVHFPSPFIRFFFPDRHARAYEKRVTHLTSDRCVRAGYTVHNISDSKSHVYTLSLGKSNISVEYTCLLISFRSTRPRISRCILQRYRRHNNRHQKVNAVLGHTSRRAIVSTRLPDSTLRADYRIVIAFLTCL